MEVIQLAWFFTLCVCIICSRALVYTNTIQLILRVQAYYTETFFFFFFSLLLFFCSTTLLLPAGRRFRPGGVHEQQQQLTREHISSGKLTKKKGPIKNPPGIPAVQNTNTTTVVVCNLRAGTYPGLIFEQVRSHHRSMCVRVRIRTENSLFSTSNSRKNPKFCVRARTLYIFVLSFFARCDSLDGNVIKRTLLIRIFIRQRCLL